MTLICINFIFTFRPHSLQVLQKLKVVMTKPKETYVYAVKKLPEPINVDRVCYKVFTDHCCLELQVNKSFLFVHVIQFVIFCISDLTKG